ncbi:heme ABC transporter ATP-binding protein [Nocardioides sp. AE5]|uniref:heme ABC transporter ATP-binding protein n=1 Tax=Nocardioides sp. AE5 TaxID=2962573 RepID=UPI00288283EA|nr:heme ABC transporter ATP-binding protein [Nocardioides sp. AE5]MDT0201940.1 heme ABC transporter ATP-binding protein [Nocardioides sp. AE5]
MGGMTLSGIEVRIGQRKILDDVTVEFPAGKVTVVIGPNGAGKSTMLAVAAGSIKPHAGVARLGDDDLRHLPARQAARRRAVMPQDSHVAFPFTVREVVEMGRTPWSGSSPADRDICDEALELTQMTAMADREITTLSGGERQRAALARVITQATPVDTESVILLDEPTSAMDIGHAEATLSLARDLARRGAAIGIVLHDIDSAAAFADQVVLMHHGQVHVAGTVGDVCRAETLSDVYETPIEVFERDGRVHVTPRR